MVLGIDGGGSKTIFALSDTQGNVVANLLCDRLPLLSMNAAALSAALNTAVDAMLRRIDSPKRKIRAVCAGIPTFGESGQFDEMVQAAFASSFPHTKRQIVNDAEIAWAGSFALKPGVNVVCGTGAIAFGVDTKGNTARCGGWSQQFGDEGSGYWLGRKTMELFCRQADGRLEKRGILYHIVKNHFHIENDYQLIRAAERDYGSDRKKMASLQILLMEAAKRGDMDAIDCYRQAAYEIALNVKGILKQLDMARPVSVSYAGGIFHVGRFLFDPFVNYVEAFDGRVMHPVAPPWIGALMAGLDLLGGSDSAMDRLITCRDQKITEE